MPQVFQKNCKISVIEYGESSHNAVSMKDLLQSTLAAFKTLIKA